MWEADNGPQDVAGSRELRSLKSQLKDTRALGSDQLLVQAAACLAPQVLGSVCLQTLSPRLAAPSPGPWESLRQSPQLPQSERNSSANKHQTLLFRPATIRLSFPVTRKQDRPSAPWGQEPPLPLANAGRPAQGTSVFNKHPLKSYEKSADCVSIT